jgi:hypothetical protein
MFKDGVNDDKSEVSMMINEVLNLIYRVLILAFKRMCLSVVLLTPQNEGINLDLRWAVNNHISLNYVNFDNIFTDIKYNFFFFLNLVKDMQLRHITQNTVI